MKVLIINGSPHKGNSWTILELVRKRMQEKSQGEIEFIEVHLADLDIPFCTGCFNCFTYGEDKCPHHNIINPIAKLMKQCDATIFLSATYSLNVTAITKNFVDHMSYNFHRPRYFVKKALIITTTAGAGNKKSLKYLKDIFKHWGFNKVHTLSFKLKSSGGYIPTKEVIEKSEKVADEFLKEIESKKLNSPNIKRIFYYNFWRAMSLKGTAATNYDNYYWQQTGLIDIPFYEEVPLDPIKKSVGNGIYNMTQKMITK